MASILRSILLALGVFAAWTAPAAQASEIDYSFDFSVRLVPQDLWGGPIQAGDRGTMTFRVDASTPSDQGGVGWARYSGAVVGGGVTLGSFAWTFGGFAENYVVIWNDQPLPPLFFEGMDFEAPLHGPALNGLEPVSFSALLLHVGTAPSDAITSLSFPTSLDLADFDTAAAGELGFYPLFGFVFGQESYILDLHDVRVTQEPPTLLLLALGIAASLFPSARRRMPLTRGRLR